MNMLKNILVELNLNGLLMNNNLLLMKSGWSIPKNNMKGKPKGLGQGKGLEAGAGANLP